MNFQPRLLWILPVWMIFGTFVEGAEPNTLSPAEERGGWKLLFDGKTTDGWRNYKADAVSNGWVVEDGSLIRKEKGAGDIITDGKYENFDLLIDYKIGEKGNSGIMFMVQEGEGPPYRSGPEIQVQDNVAGKDPQKAGWLYQLYPAGRHRGSEGPVDATRPAGEWNQLLISIAPTQCEIYMNGIPYSKFQIGSKDWENRLAKSKFAKWPEFAKVRNGHICLQDHGDVVAYRNIKIRPRGENGAVPDPSDRTLAYKAELAFPNLKWDGWEPEDAGGVARPFRTILLDAPRDGSNKLYVGDQWGSLYSFENRPDVTTSVKVIDLEDKIQYHDKSNEEGLLGLAFHPDFRNNGYFYLYYTEKPGLVSVISRFTMKDGKADPASELELLRIPQPYWNHNGGTIAFGPDGMLYIALGDGGSGSDPLKSAQDLGNLLGKILRIDVDHPQDGKNYGIPNDNPFVKTEGARPEVFAYGVRNPWRIAFDRKTGELWAGEVGQNLWEEIFIIKKGGNYGWSVVEGLHPHFNTTGTGEEKLIDPIWEYDHFVGKSITGGSVYRGKKLPELEGKYLYADYVTGKVWALKYDAATGQVISNELVLGGALPILSWGEDAEGEIYFCTVAANGNGIYKLVRQ